MEVGFLTGREHRVLGRLALVVMACFIASAPALARADTEASGFTIEEWRVLPACGDQAHFAGLVREAIGEWPANLPEIRVSVTISQTEKGSTLVLSTKAPSGEGRREIAGSSCEELLQTAAVVLSLALDSEALYENELEHEVQTSDTRELAPKAVTTGQIGDDETPGMRSRAAVRAASKKSVSESLDTSLHLVAMTDVGTLPRTAFGLGVLASAYSGPYRVSFRLTKWADQVQYVPSRDDRGGSFELLSGGLHVCRELAHYRNVPWGVCVQGTIARMSATGIVEADGMSKDAVNVLASAGAGFFINLPLQLRLYAEANGQIVRPRYTVKIHVDPVDSDLVETQVHQPPHVAFRLGIGWGLSF